MTEYEMIDSMISSYALGVSSIVLYISVLSSYLVIAYFVGEKISTPQLIIITALFVLSAIFATWASVGFLKAGRILHLSQSTLPVFSSGIAPYQLIFPIEMLGIPASLYFMWSVRNRKPK